MADLIKVETEKINDQQVQAVSARDLHKFLEVGRDFTNWISDRIKEFEFLPNRDYAIIAKSGEIKKRGPKLKEYFLSIDMAKELSMVERNEKGKQARKYFIEVEKQWKAQPNWNQVRGEGKQARKLVTDIIALFIEYAKKQGSSSPEMYYQNFSKMVNSSLLEIEGTKPKNLRDQLNINQLHALSVGETVISKSIVECMSRQLFYKEIYQVAKTRLEQYALTVGKSKIGQTERQMLGLIG